LTREMAGYELSILEHGGAEQDPLEWWAAMCLTTRKLLARTDTDPRSIAGISFCSQDARAGPCDKMPTRAEGG